mmetsp:Transcript_312/g.1007  ORF Transcript_312/g.1007 Transcript_312/m.1007 type:complete len:260 (+) Transcript_312:131-910(+)
MGVRPRLLGLQHLLPQPRRGEQPAQGAYLAARGRVRLHVPVHLLLRGMPVGVLWLAACRRRAADGRDPQGAAQPPLPSSRLEGLVHHARLALLLGEPGDRRDRAAAVCLRRLRALRAQQRHVRLLDDSNHRCIYRYARECQHVYVDQPAHSQVAAPRDGAAQHRRALHARLCEVRHVQAAGDRDGGVRGDGVGHPHLHVAHALARLRLPPLPPDHGALGRGLHWRPVPRTPYPLRLPADAGLWHAAGGAALAVGYDHLY